MAKDPAVLFYTADFMTGTMTMSHEQVGKYIRLLCLQHQKFILSEKDMYSICGEYDEDVFNKFINDENGCYYNKRMMEEQLKRIQYSESRSKNRKSKPESYENHMKIISKSYEKHMENENENENENINTIINYLNEKTGKRFTTKSKSTIRTIKARLKESRTIEDFKKVIDIKCNQWLNDKKMCIYLRPETLFGSKFESYLNEEITNKKEWGEA